MQDPFHISGTIRNFGKSTARNSGKSELPKWQAMHSMDIEDLRGLYETSGAWRLLRRRRAPFILSFLFRTFKAEETPAIPAVEVEGALLDFYNFYGDREDPEDDETTEDFDDSTRKIRIMIEKWVKEGWLRRYPDEHGADWLELTADTEKTLAFVGDLQAREFVGTESRLQDIFRKLQELVSGSQEDPQKKIEEMKAQIRALENQVRDIQRTGRVDAFNDTQIKERFHEVNRTARELLSDFREVEKVFKQIVRDIYDRQAAAAYRRGELLGFALDQIEALQDNDQGRSFYAFWEYLLDERKQDELRALVEAVFNLLEDRGITVSDPFLRNVRRFLFANGQKVFNSNQLLAEKLNRIVAEQNLRERKRVLALIDAIRKAAQERREDPPAASDFWAVETNVQVSLPLDRPLGQAPAKPVATARPSPAENSLDGADLELLVNQFFVDQKELRRNIQSLLKDRQQVSLEEVLRTYPLRKGLAEVMTYFAIASGSTRNFVDPDHRFSLRLPGDPGRRLDLPKVIFTK